MQAAAAQLACMEAKRGRRPPQVKGGAWCYGKLPQYQRKRKLELRRQALLFSCRREGLFHPMGNVLDKSKLIIYPCSFQLFVGSRTPPPNLG